MLRVCVLNRDLSMLCVHCTLQFTYSGELLDITSTRISSGAMRERTVQLVLQYDGSRFAGWQRQPATVTVQGAVEGVLERLFERRVTLIGAGRTDAGVHARGQAAHVRVPETWNASKLRRALNSLLPPDVWMAQAHNVTDHFHARYSAISRRYTYQLGTDDESDSPFRRGTNGAFRGNCAMNRRCQAQPSHSSASISSTASRFVAPPQRPTSTAAPSPTRHGCANGGRLDFTIEANRFLHHMVRFLVGTMIDVAAGRRRPESFVELLGAPNNLAVSPPAPSHGLFLDRVAYPAHFYPEGV